MEKVRALLQVLDSFALTVAQVKKLVTDVETDVKEHTRTLKNYLEKLEKENGRNKKFHLQLSEQAIDEKIRQVNKEIELLEKLKKEKSSENSFDDYNSISQVYDLSFESSVDDDDLYAELTEASDLIAKTPVSPSQTEKRAEIESIEKFFKSQKADPSEAENYDPEKEAIERKRMKYSLVVKSGWKTKYRSCKEIQFVLKKWTNEKKIFWTVERKQYKNNDPIVYARFKNYNDRHVIMDQWEKSNQFEGALHMSKATTEIEGKERKKILDMFDTLKDKGYNVIFNEKSICVDGQWWKYFWSEGWRKV